MAAIAAKNSPRAWVPIAWPVCCCCCWSRDVAYCRCSHARALARSSMLVPSPVPLRPGEMLPPKLPREKAVAVALSRIGGFIGVCADTDVRAAAAVTGVSVAANTAPLAPAAAAAAVASVRVPVRERALTGEVSGRPRLEALPEGALALSSSSSPRVTDSCSTGGGGVTWAERLVPVRCERGALASPAWCAPLLDRRLPSPGLRKRVLLPRGGLSARG